MKKSPFLLIIILVFNVVYFSQTTQMLELSKPLTQEVKGGETNSFSIKLSANQTAKIEIEQKNVDLTIFGFTPNGAKIVETGIDSGLSNINFILLNAVESGDYKLEISPTDKKLKPSNYALKLAEIRATTENDRQFVEAANQIFQLLPAADALGRTQKEKEVREAVEKYLKIIEFSKVLPDKSFEARMLLQIYFIHLQLTEYQKALDTANQALAIWEELGNKSGQALMLDKIGIIHNRLKDFKLAVTTFEKALQFAREVNYRGITSIFGNLALVYDNQGNTAKAIEFHLQALEKQREFGFRGEEGRTLVNLGYAYFRISQYDKASENYNLALPILREVGDKVAEAALLQNTGILYNRTGETRKALDYFQQAFAMNKLTGDKRGQANNKSSIGGVYDRLGEYETALASFEESIKIYRELGNRGEGAALNNYALLLRNLGEDERALEIYGESLAIRKQTQDRRGEATVLANMGRVHEDRNELAKARINYEQALNLWREFKDRDNEARAISFLGNVERKENNYINATKLYSEALEINRTLATKSAEAENLANLGTVAELQNDKSKAIEYFIQALAIQKNLENQRNVASNLYNLARLKKDLNQLPTARQDIETAIGIIEKLRERVPTQTLRSSFFATVQNYYDLYIEILLKQHELEPNKGLEVLAFEVSERGRSRSLVELLQEARVNIRQGADAKLLQREQELQELLNQKALQRTQLLGGKFTAEQRAKADSEISSLSAELENIRARLRQESPRYASLTQVSALSAKDIQNLLDDQTVLLEYKLGKDKSALWLIGKNSIKFYPLPAQKEIEYLAKSYYESIISRNKADEAKLPELTRKLNDILLAPIVENIAEKRLVIVADGVLQYIPFASLAEENEIVTLPSARVLAELRRKTNSKTPEKSIAIFADAVFEAADTRIGAVAQNSTKSVELKRVLRDFNFGENLPRLLSSREEARNIASLVAKDKASLNTDFEANRENVLNGNLSNYQILHFATHGLLDTSRPELTSLVFSLYDEKGKVQDGFLRLNQIYNLSLQSDLVVLSACQTALGKDIRGEGLVGLTRGFMYAGAKRIVASLWKVDDAATAEFMKRFYQNLLVKNLKPANALRQTQNEMKQIPRFKSPYYWAGFTIQGDWK